MAVASVLTGCAHRRSIEAMAYRDAMRDLALEQEARRDTATIVAMAVQPRQQTAEERWRDNVALRIDSALADTACLRFLTAVSIYDITAEQPVYRLNEQVRMRPASTEKLVTAIAALDLLGTDYTFDTRILTQGTLSGGTLSGDLWIVGSMDPVMTKNDLRELCRAVKKAGVSRVEGHVYVDLGLKDKDKYGWGWCWDDKNPTLTPLLLGGKPEFIGSLSAQLQAAGISMHHTAVKQGAVPEGARELVRQSRPLMEVLEPMMKKSDNLYAECVFYQMASLTGKRMAAHADVAAVIGQVIDRAGASSNHVLVADGSGLSLYNYQTAETYIALLRYIHAKPEACQMLMQVLPIAAVDGTLKNRMSNTAAADNLRAKTGTVAGVSTLTGYTTSRTTGHLIAFAILTNGVEQSRTGHNLQDKICIAISE